MNIPKAIDKEEKNNKNNKNNKFICQVCGNTLYKSNKKRHERTIKHNEIKYIWMERFEIIR
jgi:hypothetical protein